MNPPEATLPLAGGPTAPAYRILVVDDTRAIHEDFRKILTPESASALEAQEALLFGAATNKAQGIRFEVHSAYQGREALAAVERASSENRRFSLVFMDVRMPPGWDGIETTERIWEVDPDIQVVICTAYSDYSWNGMSDRLGLKDNLVILKKPFDTVEVLQLAHALTRKWTLGQAAKRNVEQLNELVSQRTRELLSANENLIVDITRRQLAEDALRKTQQRLSHLISHCPAVIYSFAMDDKSITPAWVSENISELLGFTPGEACAPDWWAAHVHPEDWEQALASRNELLRFARASVEYRFQNNHGEYRWIRDEQRLIRGEGGTRDEIVGTWMDVTARKELEAQLRHSQKMEAIGLLAGGVAHDFNNVLAVIRLNSEIALMGAGTLQPQVTHCLEQVNVAVDRATNLTRQLLAFGRKQVMQTKPANLNDVIANLTRMLVRIIGEHVKLECRFAEGLPLVQADTGMIEQVLTNLVINARDAMPDGGELTIQTVEAGLPRTPDARPPLEIGHSRFVQLSITDTGTGIDPQNLPRMFEPFFTTKSAGKGTGLGLATAYGIVKQHGGWIEVHSEPGKGTCFTIFLPATEAASAPAKGNVVPKTRPRGGSETILLVEDEEAVRSLTSRLLHSFGYRVHEAGCGKEALETWSSRLDEIDLVLTDMMMPNGVSGRQLIEHFLKIKPGLKNIIMSGYSGDSLINDANFIRQSNSRFVQKPCAWRDLVQTVRDYLDERDRLPAPLIEPPKTELAAACAR